MELKKRSITARNLIAVRRQFIASCLALLLSSICLPTSTWSMDSTENGYDRARGFQNDGYGTELNPQDEKGNLGLMLKSAQEQGACGEGHRNQTENLAEFYLKSGRGRQAQCWIQRALAMDDLAKDTSWSHRNRLELASRIKAFNGDLRTAARYCDMAAGIKPITGSADTFGYLHHAAILRSFAKYDEALNCLKDAVALTTKDKHPEDEELCKFELAITYGLSHKVDEAIALCKDLTASNKRSLRSESICRQATVKLAKFQDLSGKSGEAIATYTNALDKYKNSPAECLAGLYLGRAEVKERSGDKAAAVIDLQDALKNYEKGFGEWSSYVLRPLTKLSKLSSASDVNTSSLQADGDELYLDGRASLTAGKINIARAKLTKCVSESEKDWGKKHPYTGEALIQLGLAQQVGGNASAALDSYDRASVIFESAYGTDDPELIEILTMRASCELSIGKTSRALEHMKKATSIAERSYPTAPQTMAPVFEIYGDVNVATGNFITGFRAFQIARKVLRNASFDGVAYELERIDDKIEKVERSLASMSPPAVPPDQLPLSNLSGVVYAWIPPSENLIRPSSYEWIYLGDLGSRIVKNDSYRQIWLSVFPDRIASIDKNYKLPETINALDLSGGNSETITNVLSAPGLTGSIECLNLGYSEIRETDFDQLIAMKHLKELNLAGTELTRAGVEKLASCNGLVSLDLTNTTVDDDLLRSLSKLPLKKLRVDGTAVTSKGLLPFVHCRTKR